MGTARAPVAGSGFWPACRERVLKPIWRSGVDSGISYQFSFKAAQPRIASSVSVDGLSEAQRVPGFPVRRGFRNSHRAARAARGTRFMAATKQRCRDAGTSAVRPRSFGGCKTRSDTHNLPFVPQLPRLVFRKYLIIGARYSAEVVSNS